MGTDMDRTFKILESSINGAVARQKIIAHNISNINTPGFKQFLVNFEEQLANGESALKLKTTNPKHLNGSADASCITRDNSPGLQLDGNNVNLEEQMNLMAKNEIYMNAATNQINKKISMKKYVLSDGKG